MAVVDEAAVANGGRWKCYPEYRDSGLDWLGEVPAHWTTKRLKNLASVRVSNVDKKSAEGQQPVSLCNYTDVYYSERITSAVEFMSATATLDQIRRFALRRGDVLITKDSESWTDIAVPAYVAEDLPDVLCGYHLALVRPRCETDGGFLARAFAAVGPRHQFHVAANGITRFGLSNDAIRTALFPSAPLGEQRAIAAFLDRETARIDALIEKKERLIELLAEWFHSSVSQVFSQAATTRVRLKHLLLEPLVYGANEPAEESDPGAPRYVRITDIDDEGRLRAETFKTLPKDLARPYLLEVGDVLFARSGATVGKSFLYESSWGTACHAGYLIRARLDPAIVLPKWVWYLTRSHQYEGWLKSNLIQSTIQNMSAERYAALPVPFLSVGQQRRLVASLDAHRLRVDRAASRIRGQIALLREYRAALISAAVTGKIDVRDEVAA